MHIACGLFANRIRPPQFRVEIPDDDVVTRRYVCALFKLARKM